MTAQDLIDQASLALDDPRQGAVVASQWLLYLNDAQEEITLNYRVLESDYSFALKKDEDRYTYPSDAVQMKHLQYSTTPLDNTSFVDIPERFEDEMRRTRNWRKPTGDAMYRYWARTGFFELTPRPTADVTDGGLITCWRLATWVVTPVTSTFELAPGLRRLVRDRMLISARRGLGRRAEAEADYQVWLEAMRAAVERIEDHSDDRRPRLRPATLRNRYGGMV